MYLITPRLVCGCPRPPSVWNFRSECLGWLIGTLARYSNRQSGGRGHVMRSGGANRPLLRSCLPESPCIFLQSEWSPAATAPRVHGISGLSVWDGSLGPWQGIRTVNRVVGAMSCARGVPTGRCAGGVCQKSAVFGQKVPTRLRPPPPPECMEFQV